MIISASRRTDIPAFYSTWLLNRLKAGFACTRNPVNRHQVSRVPLTRDVVDGIVFWTKNPAPLLQNDELMEMLGDFPYYVQFTLTGYGADVEPHVPDAEGFLIPVFRELARRIGPQRVIWRYDPIFLSEKHAIDYHVYRFAELASQLQGCTERVVISFLDQYKKTERAMRGLGAAIPSPAQIDEIAGRIADCAHEHGLEVVTCAEAVDLEAYGIEHGACIDKGLLEKIGGYHLSEKLVKDKTQRRECGCFESVDIGAYDTCPHGCRYCYARSSEAAASANVAAHDPDSPLLVGHLEAGDKVIERKARSFIEPLDSSPGKQISIF